MFSVNRSTPKHPPSVSHSPVLILRDTSAERTKDGPFTVLKFGGHFPGQELEYLLNAVLTERTRIHFKELECILSYRKMVPVCSDSVTEKYLDSARRLLITGRERPYFDMLRISHGLICVTVVVAAAVVLFGDSRRLVLFVSIQKIKTLATFGTGFIVQINVNTLIV